MCPAIASVAEDVGDEGDDERALDAPEVLSITWPVLVHMCAAGSQL